MSSSLGMEGKTWVLKAIDGSGYDDDNNKGKDNGLYCQHCYSNTINTLDFMRCSSTPSILMVSVVIAF